jgi:predicted O-methyltransferase YrrM
MMVADPRRKRVESWAEKSVRVLRDQGVGEFLRKAGRYAIRNCRILVIPYALLRMPGLRRAPKEAIFDATFTWLEGLIRPYQSKTELAEMLRILEGRRIKAVLEIGTGFGGALFWWCRAAADDAVIISIDLPEGYPSYRIPLYRAFRKPQQQFHIVRIDSQTKEALDRVTPILDGRKVDFLFIDGDHCYDGVTADFAQYTPLVAEDGLIALHDIVPGSPDMVGDVPRFWQEIKGRYRTREIVEDWGQACMGIGLIEPPRPEDPLRAVGSATGV